MKLAIMQPYFMPYIGYFQAINAVDKYLLYSNVTFIKGAWMNRNRIRMKDGSLRYIIVPLKNKSSNALISETLIDNSRPWRKEILNLIYFNYKKSEYFEEIYPLLERLLEGQTERLSELNALTITRISEYLDITTEIESDNTPYQELERELETVDSGEKKVIRIYEICRHLGCNSYINAIGGQALYNKAEFAEHGITLNFIQTNAFTYPQFGHSFEPNLSIVDVLMHNGKEGTKKLLDEFTLI